MTTPAPGSPSLARRAVNALVILASLACLLAIMGLMAVIGLVLSTAVVQDVAERF